MIHLTITNDKQIELFIYGEVDALFIVIMFVMKKLSIVLDWKKAIHIENMRNNTLQYLEK
ncbi:MAG: hypothetical protein ACI8VC_001403 [Candidatus Endobugula sp.]|jgi:hypothetical protein